MEHINISIPVKNEAHAKEVAASMQRVGLICAEIVRREPQGWYGVGRAIADAENAVPGCCYAEVEFAAYLSGLALREGA